MSKASITVKQPGYFSTGAAPQGEVNKVGKDAFFYSSGRSRWVVGHCTGKTSLGYACRDCESGEIVSRLSDAEVFPVPIGWTFNSEDCNDLLELRYVHTGIMQIVLEQRYLKDFVYTFIGDLLVLCNPYNNNISRYNESKIPLYIGERVVSTDNIPHVWSLLCEMCYQLKFSDANYTIVYAGESGSGKSETAQNTIKYLTHFSTDKMKKKLLALNAFFQSFLTCKTVGNDSCSRCLSMIKFGFTMDRVNNCQLSIFCIDREKVTAVNEGERLYNIFYQVYKASQKGLVPTSLLDIEVKALKFDNQTTDDVKMFQNLQTFFTAFEFSDGDQKLVFRVIELILLLLNTEFISNGKECKVFSDKTLTGKIQQAAGVDLMAILSDEIQSAIKHCSGYTSANVGYAVRDSICSELYVSLITFITEKVNAQLRVSKTEDLSSITLIDNLGFQNNKKNAFFELNCNYFFEEVLRSFNEIKYSQKKSECESEGVAFERNKEIEQRAETLAKLCKTFHDPAAGDGVLNLLNREAKNASGNDESYFQAVSSRHGQNALLTLQDNEFSVQHSLGTVQYCVEGIVRGCRSVVGRNVWGALAAFPQLKPTRESETSFVPMSSDQTLPETMKKEYDKVWENVTMNTEYCRWVICVNTNASRKPRKFECSYTLCQLENIGLSQIARVQHAGFPIKMTYEEFLVKFNILSDERVRFSDLSVEEHSSQCQNILIQCQVENDEVKLGSSKIFLKMSAVKVLEMLRARLLEAKAVQIQAFAKAKAVEKRVKKQLYIKKCMHFIDIIQRFVKGFVSISLKNTLLIYRREKENLMRIRQLLQEENSKRQTIVREEEEAWQDILNMIQEELLQFNKMVMQYRAERLFVEEEERQARHAIETEEEVCWKDVFRRCAREYLELIQFVIEPVRRKEIMHEQATRWDYLLYVFARESFYAEMRRIERLEEVHRGLLREIEDFMFFYLMKRERLERQEIEERMRMMSEIWSVAERIKERVAVFEHRKKLRLKALRHTNPELCDKLLQEDAKGTPWIGAQESLRRYIPRHQRKAAKGGAVMSTNMMKYSIIKTSIESHSKFAPPKSPNMEISESDSSPKIVSCSDVLSEPSPSCSESMVNLHTELILGVQRRSERLEDSEGDEEEDLSCPMLTPRSITSARPSHYEHTRIPGLRESVWESPAHKEERCKDFDGRVAHTSQFIKFGTNQNCSITDIDECCQIVPTFREAHSVESLYDTGKANKSCSPTTSLMTHSWSPSLLASCHRKIMERRDAKEKEKISFLKCKGDVCGLLRFLKSVGHYQGVYHKPENIMCEEHLKAAEGELLRYSTHYACTLQSKLTSLIKICEKYEVREQNITTGVWTPIRQTSQRLLQSHPMTEECFELLAEITRFSQTIDAYRKELCELCCHLLNMGIPLVLVNDPEMSSLKELYKGIRLLETTNKTMYNKSLFKLRELGYQLPIKTPDLVNKWLSQKRYNQYKAK